MKRLTMITLGAAVALALPGSALAQTDAGSITATASVNTFFTQQAVQNLSFDAVNPGDAATINPVDGTGGTPGYVEFDFNDDWEITATALPTTLTHTTEATATVTVSWTCGTSAGSGTNPTSVAACAENDTWNDTGVTASGTVAIWLGGTISNTDVLAGTYDNTGDPITFTMATP